MIVCLPDCLRMADLMTCCVGSNGNPHKDRVVDSLIKKYYLWKWMQKI